MDTTLQSEYRPSRYALNVIERGDEIVASQIARLQETILEARGAMQSGNPARIPLEIDVTCPACSCGDAAARTLDTLSNAIVRAQSLVSHESRASAILFLDRDKRDRWESYGAYRRDWDRYVSQVHSRH